MEMLSNTGPKLKESVAGKKGVQLIEVQSWISCRNQSFDLQCKSNDWFLYEMQH